jgi:hypothetical protein
MREVLVLRHEKNAYFHVSGLFMAKKHDFKLKKKIRAGVIFATPTPSTLRATKLKFCLSESFGPT